VIDPIPTSDKEVRSGTPQDPSRVCDAYEWFWVSLEGGLSDATQEQKKHESEPVPGAAYEAFLGG
jgi:hypothetical protein